MSSKLRFMPHEEDAGTEAQRKLFHALLKTGIPVKWEQKVCGFKIDMLTGPHEEVCVEVDGESHLTENRRRKDKWKDHVLRKNRYKVLRFTDEQVKKNVGDCVAEIVYKLLEKKN